MDEHTQELTALLASDVDRHFERLILAYQHQLYGFALRQVGNASDAEDILQETFLRVHHALKNYPVNRVQTLQLQQWLYKVMLNVIRNYVRRREPEHLTLDLSDTGPLLDIQGQSDEPEREAEVRERKEELAAILSRLPERYKVAVDLHYFEEMSLREIAELLNQPVGTVKSDIHRAIQLLRKAAAVQAQERG